MNEEQTYPALQNDQDVHQPDQRLSPPADLLEYFREYARERPEIVALWCVGIGFVLGWKLKMW
jgi:hypothetical protein